MPTRKKLLLTGIPRHARIIEIGPSFNPVASKAEGWRCWSVDHLDRDELVAKYANDPSVDTTRIEEVDFVWTGGAVSDAVPPELHGSFDAFIASHVIEHTPDLLAFLIGAEILLKPDGVVILAIPDKRYCFDYFQPLTTTGQIIEAHAERRSRHTRRLSFDHVAYSVSNNGRIAWEQSPVGTLRFVQTMEEARTAFETAETEYFDIHAWRFTPASFELLLLELAWLDETDWRAERVSATAECEFCAWLRHGGKAAAKTGELTQRRLTLLERTLLETKEQIDWFLARDGTPLTSPLRRLLAPVWRHAARFKGRR
jgi:predicted SAM-dependent methyltransferase